MQSFGEKIDRYRSDLKVRLLTKRLYDAKDKLDAAFAEIDVVNREIRILHKSLEAKVSEAKQE